MSDLSQVAQGWLDIWRQADTRIAEAEAVKAKARAELLLEIGDDTIGCIDGEPVVRWTPVESLRVDSKILKSKYPDAYADCQRPSWSRRFTVVDK